MKDREKISWRDGFRINLRAIRLLYRVYPQMLLSKIIWVIWSALTPYVGIYLSAQIIEELSTEKNPDTLKALVLTTLGVSALIALLSALLTRWKNTHSAGVFFKNQQIFFKKLLDMDFVSVDDTKTHDLLTRIYQSQNSGGWGLYRVIQNDEDLLSSVFTTLGGAAMTVTLFTSKVPESESTYAVFNNPLFLLLVVIVMVAVTLIAPALSNRAGSYWAKHAGEVNLGNRLFTHFGFLGYKREFAADIRIYCQDVFFKKHGTRKGDVFHSNGIFAKYARGPMGLLQAASSAVSVIFTGVVYLYVGLKAWAGAFGVGMVTQYVASITKVSDGISKLVSTAGDMKNNAVFLKQVFEFLDIPNTMYQGSLTVEKRRDCNYQVEFRNVSFRYPGSDQYALRHVNMTFDIGKRLAVVGRNGSGKTTFIKLLCRLYDPTEGEILLNGIDIRKYNYLEYMTIFSVVFQDFKLFSLPLGENVAAGSKVNEKRAVECLNQAGFGERLSELPHGLDTFLYRDYHQEGINISGGEAQKIVLARALYKDAPFIILDEPTAALDPIAEAEIYSKFDTIASDKTAIYISHRLSSCKFCDKIAVFDHGSVVQMGTHSELVADSNGKYYELWNAQAQYYTAYGKD